MPCRFLEWAAANLGEKHAVFDEDTMTQLDVDAPFAFVLLEVCFLGQPGEEEETQMRRGQPISCLFQSATAKTARTEILSEENEEEKSAEQADVPASIVKTQQK